MTPTSISLTDLDASPDLLGRLVALNNEHAKELSWADGDRLRWLIANAYVAERVGEADGLLIAFDQDASYDSENFLWFHARLPRFVYVDRVVTALQARGRGHARAFYDRLIEQARSAGHERIVCEVNSEPPNPASEAFHFKMGFEAIGSSELSNGKIVTYLQLRL